MSFALLSIMQLKPFWLSCTFNVALVLALVKEIPVISLAKGTFRKAWCLSPPLRQKYKCLITQNFFPAVSLVTFSWIFPTEFHCFVQ